MNTIERNYWLSKEITSFPEAAKGKIEAFSKNILFRQSVNLTIIKAQNNTKRCKMIQEGKIYEENTLS